MKPVLALFDFDGTITKCDSSSVFYKCLYNNKLIYLYRHFFLCIPELILYRFGLTDYLPLKKKRLQIHVGRLNDFEFSQYLNKFESQILPYIVKKSALDRLNWHKSNHHDIWIVSASYDFLLSNWCKKLGLKIIVNQTVKTDGKIIFIGDDCNYNVKLMKIKEKIQLAEYSKIYAYGDSVGDNAMLSLAHEPHFNLFI